MYSPLMNASVIFLMKNILGKFQRLIIVFIKDFLINTQISLDMMKRFRISLMKNQKTYNGKKNLIGNLKENQ